MTENDSENIEEDIADLKSNNDDAGDKTPPGVHTCAIPVSDNLLALGVWVLNMSRNERQVDYITFATQRCVYYFMKTRLKSNEVTD